MLKSIVMRISIPRVTLIRYDHHMQRGTTSEASETSSEICTMESDPRLQYMTYQLLELVAGVWQIRTVT